MCRCCGEGGSYGEMLLLIAIHLREKQLPQLEDLTSNILGMKVTVRSDALTGPISLRALPPPLPPRDLEVGGSRTCGKSFLGFSQKR